MRILFTAALLLIGSVVLSPTAIAQLPLTNFGEGGIGSGGGGCGAAPDGSLDLSLCSNAYYLALII